MCIIRLVAVPRYDLSCTDFSLPHSCRTPLTAGYSSSPGSGPTRIPCTKPPPRARRSCHSSRCVTNKCNKQVPLILAGSVGGKMLLCREVKPVGALIQRSWLCSRSRIVELRNLATVNNDARWRRMSRKRKVEEEEKRERKRKGKKKRRTKEPRSRTMRLLASRTVNIAPRGGVGLFMVTHLTTYVGKKTTTTTHAGENSS